MKKVCVSKAELAELLGVAKVTIWRWLKAGKLTCRQGMPGYRSEFDLRQVIKAIRKHQLPIDPSTVEFLEKQIGSNP